MPEHEDKLKFLASRIAVGNWLHDERYKYADTKYNDKNEVDYHMQVDSGIGENSWYEGFIGNYFKRAQLFGLNTPQGRQALGKMIVTCLDALESSVRVFGPMPRAGVPSGEIILADPKSVG